MNTIQSGHQKSMDKIVWITGTSETIHVDGVEMRGKAAHSSETEKKWCTWECDRL